MATTAYSTTLSISGTAIAMTDEATSSISSTVYEITNAAKRRIDPNTAVTVKANSVVQAASTYSINFEFGRITFNSAPTAPVAITGAYLPVFAIGEVTDLTLSFSMEAPEVTPLSTSGWKSYKATVQDLSGSFSAHQLPNVDVDTGAGIVKLSDYFNTGANVLIDVVAPGSIPVFRGHLVLTGIDMKPTASALVDVSANFAGAAIASADGKWAGWNWAP
jgi:hypothetical protein